MLGNIKENTNTDNLGIKIFLFLVELEPRKQYWESFENFKQRLGWQTQGRSHHSKESNACKINQRADKMA